MELSMGLSAALDAVPTDARERIDREAGQLAGSRCRACHTASWPSRAVCHRCGSADVEALLLSTRGRLITHTTVWISRGPLEAPFTLGQVDLPEGVLVFAHVRGLQEGHVVPLAVELVLDADPEAVPPFWFEPLEDA